MDTPLQVLTTDVMLMKCCTLGLRLWPPVPLNSREANVDTVLPRGGGPDGRSPIFIEAGQSVNYHVYSMHRLPSIFGEDADVFRPSRWDDPKLRPGWGYIP